MHRHISSVALVAAAAAIPALAAAQAAPRHEFGVDVGLGLESPSGGSTQFVMQTPVDVRVGLVSAAPLSWEGRLTLAYASKGFGAAGASYSLAPDIQALLKLGKGSGPRGMLGPYATVGAGLNFLDAPTSATTTSSSVVFRLNGGIGDRLPLGSDAWRIEGFIAYDFKNTTIGVPGTLEVGARVGLSFWH
jgi:hypothetical protein